MNVTTFLGHYGIHENPFRAEEAWQDTVFTRIENDCRHPDFEKICGDFVRPSTSIVFGERGSGKTAIRMQIEEAVEAHNHGRPDARCLVIAYDDLNPMLDRFHRHQKGASPEKTLKTIELIDHQDAMLGTIVPRLVDQVLGTLRGRSAPLVTGEDFPKQLRQLDRATKRDLLLLQLCYDRPEAAPSRTSRLKRALRYHGMNALPRHRWEVIALTVVTLGVLGAYLVMNPQEQRWLWTAGIVALAAITLGLGGRFGWLWLKTQRLAGELARNLRVMDRPASSYRASQMVLPRDDTLGAELPRSESDEPRYAMFERLLNVIRPFGYGSVLVLVDRIDEPTLISGEPARMQALIWPLLNNKFLQQAGIGFKMLLPVELRYRLRQEGVELFRHARLDKQNYVDRLAWSGATLYDLCTTRLAACRSGAGDDEPVSLMDFFDASITHQDLVDALDQMHQPRDAFKFLYALIQEHCSNVPEEKPEWKIARQTLDSVRKQQAERMSDMLRGMQPA